METEVLLSLLSIAGLVIAALTTALMRQRKNGNNRSSNPGHGCQAMEVWEKHHRYQDAMTQKMDDLIREMTQLRIIVEERLPRGG